jgi:membrane fusion protein (multidrug efflux system)
VNRKKLFLLIFLGLALLSWFGWHLFNRGKVSTDDAYVDGRVYTITPRVPGYVVEVLVEDNQRVQAGDPLVRLDPVEYEVALAESRAALASLQEDATAAEQALALAGQEIAVTLVERQPALGGNLRHVRYFVETEPINGRTESKSGHSPHLPCGFTIHNYLGS